MAAQIPALASPSILLRPLAPDDGPALVAAASDGCISDSFGRNARPFV